jgi:hypothetical protein
MCFFKKYLFFFCICSAVFLILLPELLSHSFFSKTVLNFLNKNIKGTLEVGSLNLSWLNGQKIRHLSYVDSDKGLIIQIDRIVSNDSLFSWLRLSPKMDSTNFFDLTIEGSDNELNNFTLKAEDVHMGFLQNGELQLLKTSLKTDYKDKEGLLHIHYNLNSPFELSLENFPLDLLSSLTIPMSSLLGDLLNTEYAEDAVTIWGTTRDHEKASKILFNPSRLNPLNLFVTFFKNTITLEGRIEAHYPLQAPFMSLIEASFFPDMTYLSLEAPFDVKALLQRKENNHLDLYLKNPHINANLKGFIQKDHLYLDQTFILEVLELTPWMRGALKEHFPWVDFIKDFKHSIKCFIEPHGFSLPLSLFSLEEVTIKKASIEFGKVQLNPIKDLNKILKIPDFIPPSVLNTYLNLWFTPIYFSLDKSVMDVKRADCLAFNTAHVCFWGTSDFHSGLLNFKIGLVGATTDELLLQFALNEHINTLKGENDLFKFISIFLNLEAVSAPPPPITSDIPWLSS